MNYRTVLFAIDDDPQAQAHADHAAQLACLMEARLVGLGCHRPDVWPGGGVRTFTDGDPLPIDLRAAEDAALAREQVFLQRCQFAGLRGSEAVLESSELAAALSLHALYADLVIISQPPVSGACHAERRRRAHAVLHDSVRPVLMLPAVGEFPPAPESVLLAWDGSASAARAAAAALPLLQRAKAVHVVQAVDPNQADIKLARKTLEQVCRWLSAHGVHGRARIAESALPPAEALLTEAAASNAGLLVMGAWGHRRIVERLVGGATCTMVDRMTVPCLFMH